SFDAFPISAHGFRADADEFRLARVQRLLRFANDDGLYAAASYPTADRAVGPDDCFRSWFGRLRAFVRHDGGDDEGLSLRAQPVRLDDYVIPHCQLLTPEALLRDVLLRNKQEWGGLYSVHRMNWGRTE